MRMAHISWPEHWPDTNTKEAGHGEEKLRLESSVDRCTQHRMVQQHSCRRRNECLGSAVLKADTFVPVTSNPPNHVWLDEGNGRVQFLMFDKAVRDPSAQLLFVGQGVKGTFCLESQPDGGKSGFNHFHRTNTPATGDTSMHGATGEEGYWLKHVAVACQK